MSSPDELSLVQVALEQIGERADKLEADYEKLAIQLGAHAARIVMLEDAIAKFLATYDADDGMNDWLTNLENVIEELRSAVKS
jgi:predicted RNase H-like nuclease (RuvC/YqgF family)